MAFQKGKSGNPNGRPKKGKTFTDILEKVLKEKNAEIVTSKGNKTVHGKEYLANILFDIAADEKNPPKIRMDAINTIMNRVDGKPMQQEIIQADVTQQGQSIDWPYTMTSQERWAEFQKLVGWTDEETKTIDNNCVENV